MRPSIATILALSVAPLLYVPFAHAEADEAAKIFDSLYGHKVKAAQATRATADDLELAGQLLEAAGGAFDFRKLRHGTSGCSAARLCPALETP